LCHHKNKNEHDKRYEFPPQIRRTWSATSFYRIISAIRLCLVDISCLYSAARYFDVRISIEYQNWGLGIQPISSQIIGYRYTWLGYWLNHDLLILSGIILFGHSAMDRALGYGLKYPDSFQHTHLGWVGKK
jgi:hypothetical protein